MPQGAELLVVGVQGGRELVVWAAVDTEAPKVRRRFRTYATGEELEGGAETYIGSVFVGLLVFHVFDQGEEGAGS